MKRALFVVALYLAITGPALAETPWTDRPLDFALHLSQTKLSLEYPGAGEIDTKVQRIGISWRERYGERLQLGLIGGGAYLTQSNNAATAGIEPNGYHTGLSLDIELYRSARFRADFRTQYLYQRVDHESANKIVIAWNELTAQATAAALVGGGLWAELGTRYGGIDGEQRLSGTINETRPIERNARAGAIVGLRLDVERDGYVGIRGVTGMDRGVALYFGRRF